VREYLLRKAQTGYLLGQLKQATTSGGGNLT